MMRQAAVLVWCLGATGIAWGQGPEGQPPEAADPQAAAAQKRQAVQRLLQIIKGEPTIRDVQRWSLRYYKLEPERIHGLATAARLKGLIPEVEGSLDNMVGNNFTNTRDGLYGVLPATPDNPNGYKEAVRGSQDQLTWRVRAVWNLDRLVFNAESLDVKSLNSLQENLVREVTTMYFARRRLLASLLLSPPQDDEELFYELMRLDELTATLDALTGSQFGKRAWRWDEAEKPSKGEQGTWDLAPGTDKRPTAQVPVADPPALRSGSLGSSSLTPRGSRVARFRRSTATTLPVAPR
jgi:hypothetical protein